MVALPPRIFKRGEANSVAGCKGTELFRACWDHDGLLPLAGFFKNDGGVCEWAAHVKS
jgi:hypothetical protein